MKMNLDKSTKLNGKLFIGSASCHFRSRFDNKTSIEKNYISECILNDLGQDKI